VRIDAVTLGAFFQQRIAEWIAHYDLGDRGFSKSYKQATQVPSSKSVAPLRDTDMFRGPKARSTFLKSFAPI
jgi:type II secretory pathway component PulK